MFRRLNAHMICFLNVFVFNYFALSQRIVKKVLFPKDQTFSTRNRFRNAQLCVDGEYLGCHHCGYRNTAEHVD